MTEALVNRPVHWDPVQERWSDPAGLSEWLSVSDADPEVSVEACVHLKHCSVLPFTIGAAEGNGC